MLKRSLKTTSIVAVSGLALATTLSLITGCTTPKSSFLTDLYKFYPQNTNYYVELTPSEGDIKNFSKAITKLEAASGEGERFNQFNLFEKYNKDFEGKLTFGAWYANTESKEGEAPVKTTAAAPHMLAAATVKKDITLETLKEDMQLPQGQFKTLETKKGAIKAYETVASGSSQASTFALYNNILLVSENPTDIISAINQESANEKSLGNNETVTKALGFIPAKREGTFVSFQSPELTKAVLAKSPVGNNPGLSKFINELTPVSPATAASLDFDESKQVFSAEAVSLLDFSKLKDEALRKDLEAAYTEGSPSNIPDFLGENTQLSISAYGLSRYFNLYEKYFATAQEKNQIETMQSQLKMMNLDFRKNVLGLFDETFGLAMSDPRTMEMVLFANSNADTKKTLEIVGKNFLRASLTEKDFNGKKLQLMQSAGVPIQIAFGELQPKLMIIGTLPAIQLLPVTNKDAKAIGTNKLYGELSQGLPKNAFAFIFMDVEKMNANQPMAANAQQVGVKGFAIAATPEKSNSLYRSHIRAKWLEDAKATEPTTAPKQ